jgi:outer membrane biosynthesis protein TonB
MNSVFRLTILASLLIHLTVYLGLMVDFEDVITTEHKADKTMEFVLEAPAPESVVEQTSQSQANPLEEQKNIPPAPRHMEDDINKANRSDGLAESGGKQTPKPKGQENQDINEREQMSQANSPEFVRSNLSSLLQQAIDNVKLDTTDHNEDKKKAGQQLNEQEDDALDDSLVKSPLEKLEEEKARWRNMVLKRISEQISFVWVKPDGSSQSNAGVIRLNIDSEGYLSSAWVHFSSGDGLLDASILRAIRSIWRFQIPESDRLNRHYRQLEFHYRGGV